MNPACNRIIFNYNPSLNRILYINQVSWNHYEVLNVKRDCSAKEIKDSFIKLSKENHPDLNKNEDAHKKFVEINEAYKILSNTQSRYTYDQGLVSEKNEVVGRNIRNVYYNPVTDPWSDPSFYHNRDKSQDAYYESQPYYGIKGIKKVTNSTMAVVCLSLAAVLVGLQFLAIAKSVTFQRDELIRKSNEAGETLEKVRALANMHGNEEQLERLKKKFAGRINED